jgi:hypothetical protein
MDTESKANKKLTKKYFLKLSCDFKAGLYIIEATECDKMSATYFSLKLFADKREGLGRLNVF